MPDFARATVWRGQADDVRVSGETLRQVRLSQGLSMERLARRADVSYATIVRAERGRENREAALRRETVERIAQALGVVPALLIRRTGKGKHSGRDHEHSRATVRDGGTPGGPGTRGAHPSVGDRVDGDAVRDAG